MGKYKIENLRFAYNENNEVVKLSDATKKTKYYLYKDSNFELLYCSGEKLTYFKGVTGEYMNESPEHYEAKMKILSDGYFDVDGVRIQPFRVDAEKFVSKTKKPDVIFYNEDDTVLCIIEVLKTNAKTKEDIKEFINLNYTVYEYHCINQTTQLLCHSKEVETELQSKRNKYVRGRIDKFRDTIKQFRRSINEYNSDCRYAGDPAAKREIKEIKDRLKVLEELYCIQPDYEKQVRDVEIRLIDYNKSIQGVKGNISWQDNRSRQASTIIKRGF